MTDYIMRVIATSGETRALTATTKDLVGEARSAHSAGPMVTAVLGRLLTAGSMMGSTMKEGDDLLIIKVQGNGPTDGLTVTTDSKGDVKGYVPEPSVILSSNAQGKLDVSGILGVDVLSMIQDMGTEEPYVGQATPVSGEIIEDLAYYYATLEQMPISVALGILINRGNTVHQVGSFIIQLTPGTSEEMIGRSEGRLAEISSTTSLFDKGQPPEEMLEHIPREFNPCITDRMDTCFTCNCDKTRVKKALISIGKKNLQEITDDGKPVEVNCHFCNKNYTFEVKELEELYNKTSH